MSAAGTVQTTLAAPGLDVDPENLEVGDLIEEHYVGGDKRVRLVACPACFKRFSPAVGNNTSRHIARHDPEDFGLEPLRGDGDGNLRGMDDA